MLGDIREEIYKLFCTDESLMNKKLKTTNDIMCLKTLDTSIIYSPIYPLSSF